MSWTAEMYSYDRMACKVDLDRLSADVFVSKWRRELEGLLGDELEEAREAVDKAETEANEAEQSLSRISSMFEDVSDQIHDIADEVFALGPVGETLADRLQKLVELMDERLRAEGQ